MNRIIIDGANGYVASHFAAELIKNKNQVFALVRSNREFSPTMRMKKILDDINENREDDYKNLKVYNYSLLDKDFSLSENELKEIFCEKSDFFHFAASLKFAEKDKKEIFETNVEGLENAIWLFLKYSKPGSRFFYISTAYSCGNNGHPFLEKFYTNEDISAFRNYYEQSKRFGENVLKKYIEDKRLNGYVLRLSQVAGNNITGITTTDYGIFDFVKRLHSFSRRHPGETVRISVTPESTQNIIAIDKIVNYLLTLVTIDKLPTIINLVARNYIKNDDIFKCICRLLPINILQVRELNPDSMNILERIIAAGMSFTGKYSNTDLKFDTTNIDLLNFPRDNEITPDSLCRMIEYVIKH